MIYTVLTALFFCSIIVAMWMHFQKVTTAERKNYARKLRVADNKLKLLEMISADLGVVTSKLSTAVDRPRAAARQEAEKKNAKGGDAAATDSEGPTSAMLRAEFGSSATLAARVFEDMHTLLAIWNNNFERSAAEFDLFRLIRENIRSFSDYLRKTKSEIKIVFEEQGQWRCVADPHHFSRCFRAVLSQAIKQTEKGEIRVRVVMSEPVLTRKSKVVLIVTDASERPDNEPAVYDIVPDRVERNCFLRSDPSATVRMNVAQQTAIKLGGRLTFHPHSGGNMTFKFTFTAEPTGSNAS